MNKTRIWVWLVAAVILALLVFMVGCGSLIVQSGSTAPTEGAPLTVKVLDVGQGDAILIRTRQQVVLVDTGDVPARDELVRLLKAEGISTIDKLIITHPHADHIGGAAAVFQNFAVKQVYDSGQKTTTNIYKQYLIQINKRKIPFTVVVAGTAIALDNEVILKFLAPDQPFIGGSEPDLNNNSIVARLVYGKFSMLLTGDAERKAEEKILKQGSSTVKSTLLKSGHHGSRTSSSVPFLQAVRPEAVLISVGADNEYQHPHPNIIKRYKENKIKVYRTDTDGTLTVTTDGNAYTISKER